MRSDKSLLTIFFFFLSIIFVSTLSFDDDISIIRQRILEQMIWPPSDSIPSLGPIALHNAQTLNSSCYWPDVNYEDKNRAIWLTEIHLSRITTMLQGYTVNGSTEQNNTKLLIASHCALNVWLRRDWQNPNWWYNRISVPMIITSHLLMLDDNLTNFQLQKIKEISFRANWWSGDSFSTGTNLVWMIQSQLYRSLATQNLTGIEQGFTRTWEDIIIQPLGKDGIQNDYSYHFHGIEFFSAGYGSSWANNIFTFFLCTIGTVYAPPIDKLILFAQFLTKGDTWIIIANQWDWHSIGRSISEPSAKYIVQFSSQAVRTLAQTIPSSDLRNDLNSFADRLDNRPNATALIGNKHFYTSDYQVHRRTNWTAAIKMQSIRTIPGECSNGENLKAEHIGQGVLNLYTTNTDDYVQIFPLLDWKAINGITVEHDIPLEPCINSQFNITRLTFVGGVSDGLYGLTMMDTNTHDLTAKRSWHFYDDTIIALATNLTLNTNNIVWTTLASRIFKTGQITIGFFNSTIITLNDGFYSFNYYTNKTSNVQWIHLGQTDFAYILQGQEQYETLGIDVGRKTGNFDTIGPTNLTINDRILTMWINHGSGPYTLNYQYMILPNVSLQSIPKMIQQYNDEQIFSCISTNKFFHGTMWPLLKRASFILWDNITTTFTCQSSLFQIKIELTDAGAYLFTETDKDFTLTASHPIRLNSTVKVTVDRLGYGQGCTTLVQENQSNTIVTLTLPSSSQFLGASVNTKCNKHLSI